MISMQERVELPIHIIGLPANDISTRKAEAKFRRSVEALAHIHPDMSEARAIVKSSAFDKATKRYEVHVLISLPKEQFDFITEGWSVEEVFEKISVRMKRMMTKPKDTPSHRRHPSRMEMEAERFAE